MMSFIGEWIKHIVLLILLATFVDLILPNTNMKRYVKLVVGLLVILMILSPILQLFKFDFDRMLVSIDHLLTEKDSAFQLRLDEKKQDILDLQETAVMNDVTLRWEQEMTTQIEQEFEVDVLDLNLVLKKNQEQVMVEECAIVLQERKFSQESSDLPSAEIERIEPVQVVSVDLSSSSEIRDQQGSITKKEKNLEKKVLKFVQVEWNISVDKISISWIGGDSDGKSHME